MACIEEATDEDYGLRINSPYRFALGYGVEVVDLNATLPAGFGPSNAVIVTFLACVNAAAFCFTLMFR